MTEANGDFEILGPGVRGKRYVMSEHLMPAIVIVNGA
jgi:hypothetical protein